MKRRQFLAITATSPVVTVRLASATAQPYLEGLARTYFEALPSAQTARQDAINGCANRICETTKLVSSDTLGHLVKTSDAADEVLQKAQFMVQILNDFNITTAVTRGDIEPTRRNVRDYTRFIPLVRSYNNLRKASCAVRMRQPETVKGFLFASVAFGLEVALWTTGAPYKIAWQGTRYVANRTFLRFAHHGCSGCIAFAMSELHWAIRGTVYGVVEQNRVEFVWQQIQDVNEYADSLETGDRYKIEMGRSDVVALLEESENQPAPVGPVPVQDDQGFLEGLLPDIPSLDELLDFSF